MNHHKIILGALLAGLFAPALADDTQAAPQPAHIRIQADEVRLSTNSNGGIEIATPGTMIIEPIRSRVLKNAPYSAEVVTERLQNLADGNQIAQRTTNMRYRDSAGRTREETRGGDGETIVTINDPVAGQSLVLRPQSRTATKMAGAGQDARIAIDAARVQAEAGRHAAEAGRAAAEAARAQVEQMRKDGSLPTVERRKLPDGSEEIIVKRVERIDGQARARIQEDVRIQTSQALAANAAAMRNLQIQLAPLTRGAFGDAQWAAKATTRDLGTRSFDGVKAEGKLRSYEIPAGAIGNRNAIVVSDETWTAPELQVTVYTRHSDPRSGDVIFRLDKLKREEPPTALFTVPADYTVTDPLAQARPRTGAR
jgi:hypothetical protein